MANLDKDSVTQAMVDCNYKVERAAEKLGCTYMELDTFIEENPKLKGIIKIGNCDPILAEDIGDRGEAAAIDRALSKPKFNEGAMRNILSTMNLNAQQIDENVFRASEFRQLEGEAIDVINVNSFVSFMRMFQLAEDIADRIAKNEYKTEHAKDRDYAVLVKLNEHIARAAKFVKDGQLKDAKRAEMGVRAKFRNPPQGQQAPQQRGRAAWPEKSKQPQIHTHGPAVIQVNGNKNG